MYFSALPLLLLFASAICASPVHIGRRTNSDSVDLPSEHRNKYLLSSWNQFFKPSQTEVKGVEVAVQATEGVYKQVKIEVTKKDVGSVKKLIDTLTPKHDMMTGMPDLKLWIWDEMHDGEGVVFQLQLIPEDMATVKEFLGGLKPGSTPQHKLDLKGASKP